MFSNILKSIMNNNEAYHLLSKKPFISASTYELIQAFEIPISEFYNILREFSELAMINNRQLYSRNALRFLRVLVLSIITLINHFTSLY